MNLLLDTHAFLWWWTDDPKLGAEARDAVAGAGVIFVSAASAWEAAIKQGLGRLRLRDRFERSVEDSGFEKLPILFVHAERAGTLPRHHADPFDRMLVAQAQIEGLTLISHDRWFERYDVEVLWA